MYKISCANVTTSNFQTNWAQSLETVGFIIYCPQVKFDYGKYVLELGEIEKHANNTFHGTLI